MHGFRAGRMARPHAQVLERNLRVRRRDRLLDRCSSLGIGWRRAEELNPARDDLSPLAFAAIVLRLILAGPKPALDINLAAPGEILPTCFGQPCRRPRSDAIPCVPGACPPCQCKARQSPLKSVRPPAHWPDTGVPDLVPNGR